eukprot:CFRG5021T1
MIGFPTRKKSCSSIKKHKDGTAFHRKGWLSTLRLEDKLNSLCSAPNLGSSGTKILLAQRLWSQTLSDSVLWEQAEVLPVKQSNDQTRRNTFVGERTVHTAQRPSSTAVESSMPKLTIPLYDADEESTLDGDSSDSNRVSNEGEEKEESLDAARR